MRNVQIEPSLFAYILLHGVHYESIRKMHLLRTGVTEEMLCVALEMIRKLSFHFESLAI